MKPFALVDCSRKKLIAMFALCSAVLLLCAGGAQAQLTVSPSNLTFAIPTGTGIPGAVPSSAPENVNVTITSGSITFPTSSASISGPNVAEFAVTANSCSGTFTAPASCQVSVTFSSSSSSLQTATLFLAVDGFDSFQVGLEGAFGAIKLYDGNTVQNSVSSASFTNLITLGGSNLSLSCPTNPTAVLSGTPDGLGNVLTDNYVLLSINGQPVYTSLSANGFSAEYSNTGTQAFPPGNVCQNSDASPDSFNGNTYPECFTAAYRSDVSSLIGVTGDSIASANTNVTLNGAPAGVPPLNVQTFLGTAEGNTPPPFPVQVGVSSVDAGGDSVTSSMFLVTNCTVAGVVSGGTIQGTPITSQSGTSQTQTFNFDTAPGENLTFTISDAAAIEAGSTVNNVTPAATDFAVSQAAFASLVANTSAAPSVCLRVTAETGPADAGGQIYQCKGFQIQCYNPADGSTNGNNCGFSSTRNLLDSAQFDSPDAPLPATIQNTLFASCSYYLSLLSITGTCASSSPYGPNPTQLIGPGFLMFGDSTTGPACPLASPLNSGSCPLDALTAFAAGSDPVPTGGSVPTRNSIFVPVVNMPLPFTDVSLSGGTDTPSTNGWVNSSLPTANFTSNAATYTATAATPPSNGFTPVAPYELNYLFAPASQAVPDTTYPLPGATTNYNSFVNPGYGTPFCNVGGTTPMMFTSTGVPGSALADGFYNLIYQTTDCALTEELWFNPSPATIANPSANWASFPVYAFGVDTTAPTLTCTVSPAPANGQNGWYTSTVSESCSATDGNYVLGTSGSGFPPVVSGIQGSPTITLPPPAPLNATGSFLTQQTKDLAGNLSNAVVSPVFPVDEVRPVITCSFTPSALCGGNPTFIVGQTASVSFSCSDAISGIANCAGQAPATACPAGPNMGQSPFGFSSAINTTVGQVGKHTLTVTATDCAGNTSSTQETYTVAYAPAQVAFGQIPILIPVPGTNLQNYLLAAVDTSPASNPVPVYGADISATLTIPSGTLASGTATAFVADVTCTSFPCTTMPPSGSSCSVSPSVVSSSTTSITVNCTAGTISDLYTTKTGVVVRLQLPISSKGLGKTIIASGSITAATPISGTTSFTKQPALIP
jgi:hypothetical protein